MSPTGAKSHESVRHLSAVARRTAASLPVPGRSSGGSRGVRLARERATGAHAWEIDPIVAGAVLRACDRIV